MEIPVPKTRNISLTEEITVTLPAHVWLGFSASYMDTEWVSIYASAIVHAAQQQIMDPLWLKEREAEYQQHQDMGKAVLHKMIGEFPDAPPNLTDSPS